MAGRQAYQAMTASDLARQIKWVRAQLVDMFVERHPSYVSVPNCYGIPALLNLPTAKTPQTADDIYRAYRLIANLRKLMTWRDNAVQQFDHKTADFKRLANLVQNDNGWRLKDGKLYHREEVLNIVRRALKYANRGRV